MNITNKQKLKKSTTILIFAAILIFSFMLINISSGLLFSNAKLDLTQDKRNTLSENTTHLLKSLKQPVYAKIYLSSHISKDFPLLAQYAQLVLRTLNQYKAQSNGMVQIEVLDPQPFSAVEDEAKAQGITAMSQPNSNENIYFGAAFTNNEGQNYVIPVFSELRQNYLENDLSRAVAHLSSLQPKTIGIASNLPILDTSYRGQKAKNDWTFANLLKKDYQLKEVSTGVAEIPYDIDVLIVAASSKLQPIFVYALDQYIMRGGRLIIFVDPFSEVENDILGVTEPEGPNLGLLLNKTGIKFVENMVVADKEQTQTAVFAKDEVKNYYPWFQINQNYINQTNPLTKGLSALNFKTPGNLELSSDEEHKTTSLFTTSANSSYINAQIAKYADKDKIMRNLEEENAQYVVGALSEGKYRTSFVSNPLEGTDYSKKLLPFMRQSIEPAKIIVVADTDFLPAANWAKDGYQKGQDSSEIVPDANNFDFIQRAVDYLAGNTAALNVGNKKLSDRSLTLFKKLYNQSFEQFANEHKQVKKEVENNQKKLDAVNTLVQNRELYSTAKTIADMSALQRSILEGQEKLRHIDYDIKKLVNQKMDTIVSVSLVIFPIGILILFGLIQRRFSKRNQKKARSLIND